MLEMNTSNPSWNEILSMAANVTQLTAGTTIAPYHLAEKNRIEAAARGDIAGIRLWRDVWVYLMAEKYLIGEKVREVA
jgi:hypothetical protein